MRKHLQKIFILLLIPNAGYAEFDEAKLKELFMTSEQRSEVDDVRSGKSIDVASHQPVLSDKSEKVTVTGFVKRSNGKNAVWLNGKNTMGNNLISDVKVKTHSINSSNEVTVIIDGKRQLLKPGESWLRPSITNDSVKSP